MRCRAQGAGEKGSATDGPPRIEVAASADIVVATAAVLRSLGTDMTSGCGSGPAPRLLAIAVLCPVYLHQKGECAPIAPRRAPALDIPETLTERHNWSGA
ncbi:hypothetical protein GCM10010300_06060 [Streptomyces olivaceoviridis]|nr:hypothetical protein GCM10010300_06060 [Streptomyces olivaceoviridis]